MEGISDCTVCMKSVCDIFSSKVYLNYHEQAMWKTKLHVKQEGVRITEQDRLEYFI
jgi:hypothetical protein